MKVNEIDKMLGYMKENRMNDLQTYLLEKRTAIILADKERNVSEGTISKKIKAVKKYLTETRWNSQSQLKKIHFTKESEPFICNGCSLIKWNDATEAEFLQVFEQLPPKESLFYESFVKWQNFVSEEVVFASDKLVLENIGKFIKLYKSKRGKEIVTVRLFGAYFDACLVQEVVSIIGTDILGVKLQKSIGNTVMSVIVRTPAHLAMILPIRTDKNEKIEERMVEFFDLMKQVKAA